MSGRLGLAQTLPEGGALHRLVEETPHERVAGELARLIRDGLDHRRTLTALAVATSRRVQPFPDAGFKYHTVLALQSVHLTALNLPDKERWLPVFWALDYFKRAQEAERRQSGWTMGPQPGPVAGTVEAARKSLIYALDRWDLEAVDRAVLDFARLATPEQLSEVLFRYLSLLEKNPGALDQAAPLRGWKLDPAFDTLRRLIEARFGPRGKREYIQVLRLHEDFPEPQVAAAVRDAVKRRLIGFDAVKHLLLARIEKRPVHLDLARYPHLPQPFVAATRSADYASLLAGGAGHG